MNRIKRFFLKKEEKEMKKFFDSQLEAYARKMEFEITACKRRYDLMNRAFYLFPKGYITSVAQNQNEEVIIVHNEPGTAFYLISQTNQGACYLPRIFYKCYYNYSCEFPKVFIQLVDVITVEDNIGNGSILMEALIEYAKRIKATEITGSLSPVDDDHADRRNHFYEKFGFKIEGRKITLNLI